MSFDLSSLSAYIEDKDFPLVAKMQAVGGLAQYAAIQTGLKSSSNLQFIDTSVTFADDNCTRTPGDTTSFSQRTITVGAIAAPEDICVKELNGFWTQTMVKQGCLGEQEVPGEIEGIWLEKKINAIQRLLTIADFQGDTASGSANLNKYDGLLKIIDAEGTVVTGNTGSVAGITTGNVLAVMDAMFEVMPDDIADKEDKVLFMPTQVYKKYIIALKNANLFHISMQDGEEFLYGTDIRIVKTIGLPGASGSERMVLASAENIVIGMDGDAEEEAFDIRLDPRDKKKVLFDVCFKRGVQVRFPDEIVEYTSA